VSESILEEAQRLTHGDRAAAYGTPLDDYSKTAALWTVILSGAGVLKEGASVAPETAALCMIAVKLSRLLHAPKRDSAVDIAGYAWVYQEIVDEKARRT
jgi:hypothetical protein